MRVVVHGYLHRYPVLLLLLHDSRRRLHRYHVSFTAVDGFSWVSSRSSEVGVPDANEEGIDILEQSKAQLDAGLNNHGEI